MIIRVRPSKDVLATSTGTRRRTFTVAGRPHTLEFSKEAIYLEVDAVPAELAQDPHLLTREVTQEEMLAAHGTLTVLAAEAHPPSVIAAAAGDAALVGAVVDPGADTGEGHREATLVELLRGALDAERVQEPAAGIAEPGAGAREALDLKAERVQEEAPVAAPITVSSTAPASKKGKK